MSMDERVWMRHASPWSVWTRFSILPLLSVAIWSRVWWGGWALLPTGRMLLWTWLNPRAFPAPSRTDTWASKGTFGERVFLERRKTDVPRHHLAAANVLSLLTFLGLFPWGYGLWVLDMGMVISGLSVMILSKAWFLDRMVWIYEDLKHLDPQYASWLRGGPSCETRDLPPPGGPDHP